MKTSIALAFVLATIAAPVDAQDADARWTPWLGCWQMLDDRTRDGSQPGVDAVNELRERPLGASATDVTVCVAPAAQPNGVTLTTRVAGEPAFEQTIVADGVAHAMSEAGCRGSQRAEWSQDGRRLFASAELACANQPARKISGLALITGDRQWVDVQALDIDGRPTVRVRRYRPTGSASAAVRRAPAAAFSVEAVKEASAKVAPAALEAALIETRSRFRLNSTTLVDLDDARVPDAVIDVMVALSYPDRFEVERRAESSLDLFSSSYADPLSAGYLGFGYPYSSWNPGYYGNYRYLYSPFGYAYSGLYGPSYYYPGTIISGGGGAEPPPSTGAGDGRAVNGLGYTRIRPREAVPAEASDGGGSNVSPRRGGGTVSTSGYSGSGGASSGSSGGGGGSSSSGSGDSGGGGGRTAQPR
jgi:hypothetical protein